MSTKRNAQSRPDAYEERPELLSLRPDAVDAFLEKTAVSSCSTPWIDILIV
jgi:hypothetical protein